ncbi:hypothetical protein WM40_22505 [Robbsia andropogonis]|uniref:Uncharacterized protein n=1 Tax=Robbsia andropogonis TaxID=28092 RepID=A0A0F5JUK6_9BURK|nr:hypothetical protein [Robbsia andropogonis]KKB61518.1 hypothetical protein WM40_22505 [Robbsia andropogonis]
MSKYPEDKPFGEWSPEQQREFKIDVLVDGKRWETAWPGVGWIPAMVGHRFNVTLEHYYRLAPEPEISDSIDWSHLGEQCTRLYRMEGWECAGIYDKYGRLIFSAAIFASYKRGNMESCTIYRPGFEPEGEK